MQPNSTNCSTLSFSSRKARALEMLYQGKSANSIASALGIHRTTLFRWLKSQDFAQDLQDRLNASCKQTQSILIDAAPEAAIYLIDLMRNADAHAAYRLRAATIILELVERGRQSEFEQRIERLEASL